MPFWSSEKKRPTDVKVFQVLKTGTQQNNMEFVLGEDRAYYLERPDANARTWDYILSKGNKNFYVVDEGTIFRIHRDQAQADMKFYSGNGNLAFTMTWAGKGDVGGLVAGPRQHTFYHKGTQYEWSDNGHAKGIDVLCQRVPAASSADPRQTVAYFRDCLTPANRIGKLEIQSNTEERLEEMLVATFVAYREWTIRRQMLIYGDDWFNQSVTN